VNRYVLRLSLKDAVESANLRGAGRTLQGFGATASKARSPRGEYLKRRILKCDIYGVQLSGHKELFGSVPLGWKIYHGIHCRR